MLNQKSMGRMHFWEQRKRFDFLNSHSMLSKKLLQSKPRQRPVPS
jgi:hypothetical protein